MREKISKAAKTLCTISGAAKHSRVLPGRCGLLGNSLTGILLNSPEKNKENDQKGDPQTPLGSKRKSIDLRIKINTYTLNRERDVLIPPLSQATN